MPARRFGSVALVAVLATTLALNACSSSGRSSSNGSKNASTPTGPPPAPKGNGPVFEKPGPFAAGVMTVQMGDGKVDVWYPADPSAVRGKKHDVYYLRSWLQPSVAALIPADINPPFETDAFRDVLASRGSFPLVLFSHGDQGYRDQSTFLTSHLATWGFIVAAPDERERGLEFVLGGGPAHPMTDSQTLRATVNSLHAESTKRGGRLAGRMKPGKVVVTGHSGGGYAAMQFASQADVAGYVSLAAGAALDPSRPTLTLPDKPSLFMTGSIDTVVPTAEVAGGYAAASKPSRLVTIGNAGHLMFADICLIGTSGGGVIALAKKAGLPIPADIEKEGTDGCQAGALPARDGFQVVDHYVTAAVRSMFGIDKRPVGLEPSVANDFGNVKVTYRQKL